MIGHRCEVEASAGPSRGSLVGGGGRLLVRVRVFDGIYCPDPLPEAYCDLAPEDARQLAFDLLAAAEHAEQQSREAGFWMGERRGRGWSADA
ncbi:MAG: hypothetical protein ACLP22_06590 [Solirubrobacteraceae bacterium]|jgi:hypothetical protein